MVTFESNPLQRTLPVIDKSPKENQSHGSITLKIGEEAPVTVSDGEVTVPDGATVKCEIPGLQPISVDVHRDKSKPMVFDPNTDTKHHHHLNGETPYTAQEFPQLEPKMKLWEEKAPKYINQEEMQQILGFDVKPLIKNGLLHPRYEQRQGVAQFAATDILQALLVKTIKNEKHFLFWRQMRSSSDVSMTEKSVMHLREQTEWSNIVKRGRTFGVELENTVNELVKNISK